MNSFRIPVSKYICEQCKFYFEREKPGPVSCPRCGYNYIDWINSNEVLKVIWKRREKEDEIKR